MNVQGGEKKVMKKILSVALSTAMAFSMFASVAFADTAATPQQKFDALKAKGILNGYPDGQAHLEKDLTRAEFAKIVTKLFNLSEVSNKLSYKDKGYNAKNWAVPYIEAVTAANLMQGKDTVKGIFDYNGKVTVEEVATVLFRALKLEAPAETNNNASVWAKGYAQAVINKGLVAASVNFKGNATRSLVVETAYAIDAMDDAVAIASAEALSPTNVVVTFADKTQTTVTLTTPLVAGVETTINFKHKDHDYTTKVTLQAPKVVSAEAPNAKQLVVKFNRAIDPDTVLTTTYGGSTLLNEVIQVTPVSGALPVNMKNANVVLNNEGTEAWITFAGNEYLKGQYTVVVKKEEIRTTGNEPIPAYTDLINVNDTVAPTVVSVTAAAKTTTNKVQLKLSEPVRLTGLIAYVNGSAASVTRDAYAPLDEVTLTTATLNSGATYDVSLRNLSDYAGNVIAPNPFATTVAVSADVAAPTIEKLTVTGEKKVEVVFNKNMHLDSMNNNVRLLDPNGALKSMASVKQGANAKTFVLTFNSMSFPDNITSFSGSVVFGASVRDTLGNTLGSALTQPVTFAKDTTAPTIVSAIYRSGVGVVVRFSEEVTFIEGSVVTLLNDSTGVAQNLTYAGRSQDEKSITFTTNGSITGAHTLRLPTGAVKDQSTKRNDLVATTVALTGSSASSDTERPVAKITVSGAVYDNPAEKDYVLTVEVTDNRELNTSSIMDVNSYTLDNKALPAGSWVEIQAGGTSTKKIALVHIPKSSISETKNYPFSVSGIVDAANNGINPESVTVTLKDHVAPKLDSAVISGVDNNSLVLTFSEGVQDVTADDFVFTINNTRVEDAKVKITSVGNSSVHYVTFQGDKGNINLNDVWGLTVKVKEEANIKDKDGNIVTKNTEITVK